MFHKFFREFPKELEEIKLLIFIKLDYLHH